MSIDVTQTKSKIVSKVILRKINNNFFHMTTRTIAILLTFSLVSLEFFPAFQVIAQEERGETQLETNEPRALPNAPLPLFDGRDRFVEPIPVIQELHPDFRALEERELPRPIQARVIDGRTPFEKRMLQFSSKALQEQFQKGNIAPQQKGEVRLHKVSERASSWVRALFADDVHAAEFVPIMDFYDGIEDVPIDYALQYLSQHQNLDGSFGAYSRYETTFLVFFSLIEWGKTDNDQYDLALEYLTNATPTNNRERAFKIRVLFALEQPYAPLLSELLATQNDDNGFGFDAYYASDVLTSLEVLLTLSQSELLNANFLTWGKTFGYVANHIESDGTIRFTEESAPSFYLMNRVARDMFPMNGYVVELNGKTYDIEDITNSVVGFLDNQVKTNPETLLGAVDPIDYALTAETLAVYEKQSAVAVKNLLEEMQQADGGFGGILPTMYALSALAQGDLSLTGLVPLSTLTTGVPGSLNVSIYNNGIAPVSSGKVYLFADQYQLDFLFDFAGQNVVLPPDATMELEWPLDNTNMFVGTTEFRYYAEALNEMRYTNNWIQKTFTFAKHPQNMPASPVSYIAYKSVFQGTPAVQFVWAKKSDPLRKNYIIMSRVKGATQWKFSAVDPNADQIILHSLEQGKVYEVTVGSLAMNGTSVIFHSTITDVTVSASQANYLGNMNGVVTVDQTPAQGITLAGYVIGALSGDNGVFAKNNLPNGSQFVFPFDPQYVPLKIRYTVKPGQTTNNVRVFTSFTPDTTPPVGSNIAILEAVNNAISNNTEVTIVANGTDAVAIKDADFFFYNPTEGIWEYLGTSPVQNGEAVIPWFVPDTLKGSEYKIQAMFSDYQGNISSPIVFGPFIIDDTTPPIVDTDGDGIPDTSDNCVFVSNPTQGDYDQDGKGDHCDLPKGEVTGDGAINVVDVQCTILTALWELAGKNGPMPICLSPQEVDNADLNCDGAVDIVDVQMTILLSLDLECDAGTGMCSPIFVTELDANQDNIADTCQAL
ncbi:MAG: hypothetical protein A3C10_04175 [Candidatus Magasanikbacteria bacterium RIFCSPHIGHO2_02_FULL_48_18]|nr:MAG: hypothetical protein A3I74_05025 [Candidatus Magasanikbacteria bacterium RIFCSPLOWO2_02_FULL_47_16]OGH79773.1 MAG: hypothetical protein A3C10_04175 [Candidatus Magasanikbacteria bacterium RIFCSPHIGHO2_02_FULL_48_18]